ncbi:MAG: hypothetical protein QM484_06605 [Woeseiaceae bacterium]
MNKINSKTAQELTLHYDAIEDDAFDLLNPKITPSDFITKLLEKKYFADSIIFLAHALPKREAIWWACLCAKEATNDKTRADDHASLSVAEKWVYEPDEKKRRMCGTLAEKGEYKSAQNWTAAAVFWSGGSITAEGESAMEPAPYLYAHAVSGAILNAVGVSGADDIDIQFQEFIESGLNIAKGGNG